MPTKEDSYQAIIASASGYSSCHADPGYEIVSNPVCHVCGAPWHHQQRRVPEWMQGIFPYATEVLLVWSLIITVRLILEVFGVPVGERSVPEVLAHMTLIGAVLWLGWKTRVWPWLVVK